MSKKNNPYKLSVSDANDTLQNVFSACNARPNTIPISHFITEHKINTAFFHVTISLCALFILLTLLAPIPFLIANQQNHKANIMENIYVIDDYVEDQIIYLTLSTAVDSDNCYIALPDKTTIPPVSYDSKKNKIAFPYKNENTSIYVVTPNGSNATIIITPTKN